MRLLKYLVLTILLLSTVCYANPGLILEGGAPELTFTDTDLKTYSLPTDTDGPTRTYRVIIWGETIADGSYVRCRVDLCAHSSLGTTLSYTAWGMRAGTPYAWSMSSNNQITWDGGNTEVTIGAGTCETSDWFTLTYNGVQNIIIAFQSTDLNTKWNSATGDTNDTWFRAALDASTTGISGYAESTNDVFGLSKFTCSTWP